MQWVRVQQITMQVVLAYLLLFSAAEAASQSDRVKSPSGSQPQVSPDMAIFCDNGVAGNTNEVERIARYYGTSCANEISGSNRGNGCSTPKLAIIVKCSSGLNVQTPPMVDESSQLSNLKHAENEYKELAGHLIAFQQNNEAKIANLIQLMIWCVLAFTAIATIGIFWIFVALRRYIVFWAVSHLESRFKQILAAAADANTYFVSALEEFCSIQLASKLQRLRLLSVHGRLDTEQLFDEIVEVITHPARLKDDIQAIAYRMEPQARQLQRIRSIWAEVKAEAIDGATARRLVYALIELVREKSGAAAELAALQAFAKQLDELLVKQFSLPSEPGF